MWLTVGIMRHHHATRAEDKVMYSGQFNAYHYVTHVLVYIMSRKAYHVIVCHSVIMPWLYANWNLCPVTESLFYGIF